MKDDFYANVYTRSSGVTGSCNLFSIHFPNKTNYRFLVDCGMFQGKKEDLRLNEMIPFDAEKINAVFITHNHVDHTGLLPLLVQQGFNSNVYTSYATSKIIDMGLYDSCKINSSELSKPLYTSSDVEKILKKICGCALKRVIHPHKYITARFFCNGHLVGAAVLYITISYPGYDDINLLFTGDYNNKNVFFNVERLPKDVRNSNISALFTESTYGDIDSTDKSFEPCLEHNVVRAAKEGKTIVFPSFSQGRYQEILLFLQRLQKQGKIPINMKVWGDGFTGQEYTKRYLYDNLGIKRSYKNFLPYGFEFVPRNERRKYREEILGDPSPKFILAPGGMGHYGPIQKYISHYLSDENALIHYLGYCAEESKAYQLLNTDYGDEVVYSGILHTKKCEIKRTGECSGHAKRDILLAFANDLANVKFIGITHGEQETRKKFASYLRKNLENSSTQIGVMHPDYGYRITSEGVIKTFLTHFQI